MEGSRPWNRTLRAMPHMFLNRPRVYAPGDHPLNSEKHATWETINAVCYLIGGVIFMLGSIGFFPALSPYQDLGAWLFVLGSLLYLLVSGHDLMEVIRNNQVWQNRMEGFALELFAALLYGTGSLLFILGSLFFLSWVDMAQAGAWCFIVGSLLFVVGAGINVLRILDARSPQRLQLMNLTAITFIVGSVLFAVASVPYLWTLTNGRDKWTLFTYLVWLYEAGSILFLVGGIFNAWRAALVMRDQVGKGDTEPNPAPNTAA
ncbi:YrhK family protein [Rhodospirillum sp. A1_3_36]|uniref:YrhK family protein n=1 Tax=Rhodospirillum sp. A1_3_36 TaxID=3391666 RepID=UPI0039A4495D